MSIVFVSLGVIDLCVLSGCILSVVRSALEKRKTAKQFKKYALLRPSDQEIRILIQERFAANEKSHGEEIDELEICI